MFVLHGSDFIIDSGITKCDKRVLEYTKNIIVYCMVGHVGFDGTEGMHHVLDSLLHRAEDPGTGRTENCCAEGRAF